MKKPVEIAPGAGKLGILLVGLGAVSTTVIAGVHAIRKKLAPPIGSLTELGTVRLGKRTERRSPRIREIFDLPTLDNIVFGGWDIFEEDCYSAARTAGVLEPSLLDQLRPELEAVRPMAAVFDRQYVKRLDGPNVKKAKTKKELADQLVDDIRRFYSAYFGEEFDPQRIADYGWRILEDEWEFNRRAGLEAADDDLPECMKKDAIGPNGDLVFDASPEIIAAVRKRCVSAEELCGGTATG